MNKYEITINDKYLYIKNYSKVINTSFREIIITLNNKTIIINGNDLIISKMDKYDLLIKGNIKGIVFKDE